MFGFIPPINNKGNEPIICVELYLHLYYLFPAPVEVKCQPVSHSVSVWLVFILSIVSINKHLLFWLCCFSAGDFYVLVHCAH